MSRESSRGKYSSCIASWEGGACDRTDLAAHGYCFGHTNQQRRGAPIGPIRFYRPQGLIDKDLALWVVSVSTETSEGCMVWPFAYNGNGYGVMTVGNAKSARRTSPHRVVARWLVGNGAILNRYDVVHHICANRGCVNPKHLAITTAQHNTSEAQLRKEVALLRVRVRELEQLIGALEGNMSKLGEDGKPIYREDGKVLKGPNYSKPDIKEVLGLD